MLYDILIVGAGASGLAAAISAKRANRNLNIAAVEALPRVGKKLLATGNGRCNLSNLNAKPKDYSYPKFTEYALSVYSPKKIIDFFYSIGLMCVADNEGRIYPMSNTAVSVLDALRFEAERIGVEFVCEKHIENISRSGNGFLIGDCFAKEVILCTGGCAAPAQGSDGSGFGLLKGLGHHVTDLYPGLVQLTTKENTKSIKGIRTKAHVTLYKNNRVVNKSKGEVLFTDYGLSGISIMDISRTVKTGKYNCSIDVVPSCNNAQIENFIHSLSGDTPVENAISGMVPKKLGQFILKRADITPQRAVGKIKRNEIIDIYDNLKNLTFEISGTMGFKNAQITVGGAEINEFDSYTMESKLIKGLFCAGEILNIDSICGGFNLQWAWASGLLAGKCAAKALTDKR